MESTHPPGDWLQTPAGRVWFETEGEGPVLVLVPGGPGVGHAHYHPWFSGLADQRTVVYLDQLGTGRSDRLAHPAGYDVGLYADTIGALADHLGAERVDVAGISFGGFAAAEFAARRPGRVRSLVLVAAQVDAEGWQLGNIDNVNHEIRVRYPHLWRRLLGLRSAGVLSADDEYQRLLAPVVEELEWASPGHPALLRDPEYGFDPAVYRAFVGEDPEWTVGGALRGHRVLGRLRPHGLRALVVTGRHDRVTVPAVADRIARELDAVLHVFERSGHRPWAEEPEAFTDVVSRFLAAQGREAT